MPPDPHCRPASTHAGLGSASYDPVDAVRFPQHVLCHRDQRWAARVGLDGLTDVEWVAHFGAFGSPMPAPLLLPRREAG